MVKANIQLSPNRAGMRLSAEEYANADFQGPFVYERVQGRLVVMSPAGPEHRLTSRPFRRALGLYWGQHPDRVEDVDVEGWVATSPDNDRIPDICVYLVGPASKPGVPDRVPELIFEFVSPDRLDRERDYVDKRREYHAIGVREYVIVDRFQRTVLVLTWQADDFAERRLDATEEYSTMLLPGLTIPLAEVFD